MEHGSSVRPRWAEAPLDSGMVKLPPEVKAGNVLGKTAATSVCTESPAASGVALKCVEMALENLAFGSQEALSSAVPGTHEAGSPRQLDSTHIALELRVFPNSSTG